MSSRSSTSSDDVVDVAKRLRRRIDFELTEIGSDRVTRSLPCKRSKEKWYSPVNVCGSVPRFDRTLRPLRLIDEDRNPRPISDNNAKKGKEKVASTEKPYVISIPSSPSPTPPLSPPYFRPESPRSSFSFRATSPSTNFSLKGSSVRTPKLFNRPSVWPSIARRCRTKKDSMLKRGAKKSKEDNGVFEIAMNLMMEKLSIIEVELSVIRQRRECPCLESGCCFMRKSPIENSTKSKRKGNHCSDDTTSLPQPPRRRYLYERYTPQNLLDIVSFHGWFFSRQPWLTMTVPVPNKESGGVRRCWFRSLYSRDEWLLDEHIDSIMIVLAMDRNPTRDNWNENWTILETRCWGALTGNDYAMVRGLVQPYAEGDIPRHVGRDWNYIDTLYGIGNVEDSHWVLYVVSLRERRITVYDSSYTPESWARLLCQFDTFTRNLGRLLVTYGGLRNMIYPPQFEVVRYLHAPQQLNDYDCGVMALEYFRFLVNARRVEEVLPDSTQDQRIYYCSILFKFGREITRLNGGFL